MPTFGQRLGVAVKSEGSCVEWRGGRDRDGYGISYVGGRRGAHRFTWEKTYGKIPDGFCVLHHCDNPPCVNPEHLFLGTNLDNVRDRDAKGRQAHGESFSAMRRLVALRGDQHPLVLHPELAARGDRNGSRLYPERLRRGESHYNSRVTAQQVGEIRARAAAGESLHSLARIYPITRPAIRMIVRGKTWQTV